MSGVEAPISGFGFQSDRAALSLPSRMLPSCSVRLCAVGTYRLRRRHRTLRRSASPGAPPHLEKGPALPEIFRFVRDTRRKRTASAMFSADGTFESPRPCQIRRIARQWGVGGGREREVFSSSSSETWSSWPIQFIPQAPSPPGSLAFVRVLRPPGRTLSGRTPSMCRAKKRDGLVSPRVVPRASSYQMFVGSDDFRLHGAGERLGDFDRG